MALDELETRLCELVGGRGDALLTQLREHVAIPTGRDHAPGLDRYRALIIERLRALGAEIELVA